MNVFRPSGWNIYAIISAHATTEILDFNCDIMSLLAKSSKPEGVSEMLFPAPLNGF